MNLSRMNLSRSETRKETITVMVNQETHEKLGDAAHQLRLSQTKLASTAIVHYLDFLQKTKQYKPSTPSVSGGFRFYQIDKKNG
jgi:hypothetical protein